MDASNSPPGSLGLVYSSSAGGHRGPYVKLFASLLGFEGLCQPAGVATLQRLIAAPRLVLATFDDDLPMFTPAVAIRAVLGRPTVGIFLSPQRCFVTSELKCRLKKIAFKVYRRVPWLTLVTITPFDIEPRYAEVANLGAHDPQYWDLHDGPQEWCFHELVLDKSNHPKFDENDDDGDGRCQHEVRNKIGQGVAEATYGRHDACGSAANQRVAAARKLAVIRQAFGQAH